MIIITLFKKIYLHINQTTNDLEKVIVHTNELLEVVVQ